jgi:hypothetical protein
MPWELNGNATTDSSFIGTTNNTHLRFRTNNTQRMWLTSDGHLLWGSGNAGLVNDQGGSIELGGQPWSPGGGTPYIDFHFRDKREDFNVRLINDEDGLLHVSGALKVDGKVDAAGPRYGVRGFSSSVDGIIGVTNAPAPSSPNSDNPPYAGVWGSSKSGYIPGVVGWSIASSGGVGVFGYAPGSANNAGWFVGDVVVKGIVQAAEYQILSTARPSDGSPQQIYPMGSPERWTEDFGRSEVVEGHAEIKLDNEFAATVQTDGYYVFLTPEGNSQGLYVSARRPDGFEVREQQGGTSNLAFSYRVVAKRNDIDREQVQQIEEQLSSAETK